MCRRDSVGKAASSNSEVCQVPGYPESRKSKILFGFLLSLLIRTSFLFMTLAWTWYIFRFSGLETLYHQNLLLAWCYFALDCRFLFDCLPRVCARWCFPKLQRGQWNRKKSVVRLAGHIMYQPVWEGSVELGLQGKVQALPVGSECMFTRKILQFSLSQTVCKCLHAFSPQNGYLVFETRIGKTFKK